MFATIGVNGTVRSPDSDLGLPIALYRSARWRTCNSPLSRSTSAQRSPRSSEARRPVKIAVSRIGRQRPLRGPDNGLDLLARRNVDADLELAFLATLGLALGPAAAGRSKVAHDVARDEAALLRVAEQRRQLTRGPCGPSRAIAAAARRLRACRRARACPRIREPSARRVATASRCRDRARCAARSAGDRPRASRALSRFASPV